MSYWNNCGTYENEARVLSQLVPGSGQADTFKGELWRAATRIYYDYYNNGFGNNWLAPAAFLIDNIKLSPEVKRTLFEHANGNVAQSNLDSEMETMIDDVVTVLLTIDLSDNTTDMWGYKSRSNTEFLFDEEWAGHEYDEY
jgi:hypothetical protein